MNYFKRLVIIVGVFLILVFLLSMFFPSTRHMESVVIIDNNERIVQKQLEAFKIVELHNYTVDEEMVWNILPNEKGVILSASITVNFGFNPISKFSALFDKDELKDAFSLKIDSFKRYIENLPKIHSVSVEKKFIDETIWFLSIRDTVNQQEMSNIHGKLYAKINQYMDENSIVSDASPLVIYYLWTNEIVDVEAGIPISDSIMINDTLIKLNKKMPGNVVTAIHYGPYERLPETYFGINEWMRRNEVVVTGAPWESYITDPVKEENPEKWETAIFFPIE